VVGTLLERAHYEARGKSCLLNVRTKPLVLGPLGGTARAPPDRGPFRSAALTIRRGARLGIRPPVSIPRAASQGRLALPGPPTPPLRARDGPPAPRPGTVPARPPHGTPRGAIGKPAPPVSIPRAASQGRLALPGPRTVPVRSAHDTLRGAIGNLATRFNPTRC